MKKHGRNLRHKKQYAVHCEECGDYLYSTEIFNNGTMITCGECNGTGTNSIEYAF